MIKVRHLRATAAAPALAVALIAGCAGSDPATLSTPPAEPPGAPGLWLSADSVPPGAEMVAVLIGSSVEPVTFGVTATVDRWRAERWERLGTVALCLDFWFCTASLVPEDGDLAVPDIGLGFGAVERFTTAGLEPGWYRVTQIGNEDVTARGVFEVSVDADGPAPLSPVDAAAVGISPVLVPPAGGTVTLMPFVPGSRSADDVIAATEGLADDVTIERWNEDAWELVGRLYLTAPDTTDSRADAELAAEIPPLPEGAYRLVREGPAGPHYGSFLVDASAVPGILKP